MEEGNKKKNELLKEPHGTANAKLRKAILFNLLVKLKENFCFQCGNEIQNIDDLSIEHKIPWQSSENPIESFYDLDNIAFSHLKCNIMASNRKGPRPSIRGDNNPSSKYSNEKVAGIRKDIAGGIPSSEIMKKYNIDKKVLYSIKRYKTHIYE